MKNNYIKFLLIIFLIYTLSPFSFAETTNDCSNKEWYELYTCRKSNICKKEYWLDSKKNLQIVYNSQPYNKKVFWDWLKDAKKTYRNNQNNIYKCWILKIQQDSLNLIKGKLLSQDKSGDIKNRVAPIINQKLNELKDLSKKIKCLNTKTNSIQNKFNILNNSTYELCNYNSYLEYLKQYDSNINNILFPKVNLWLSNNTKKFINNKQYSIKEVSSIMTNIQNNINDEIDNSYKIFPLAYNAYSEYENNYTIHILLKLIREDYIILRNKLYATLNPISQFIYKVANAMKMP